jgi:monodehydroascorbate reductase (NADH)
MAAHYQRLYAERGVDIRTGESVKRILAGDAKSLEITPASPERAVGVELESGARIAADAVVVGVGARPVVHPFDAALRQAGVPPGGILVDAMLRAHAAGAAPGSLFAVGDVAAFPALLSHAAVTRVEHVDNARRSAEYVASQLLLKAPPTPAPYEYLPYFYSRVFEEQGSPRPVRWVFHGFSEGEVVVVGAFDPDLAAFWLDADTNELNAVLLESGDAAATEQLPALCRARPRLDADALRRATSVKAALAIAGVRT